MASLQRLADLSLLEAAGVLALALLALKTASTALLWLEPWVRPLPPLVTVPLTEAEALDVLPHAQK